MATARMALIQKTSSGGTMIARFTPAAFIMPVISSPLKTCTGLVAIRIKNSVFYTYPAYHVKNSLIAIHIETLFRPAHVRTHAA